MTFSRLLPPRTPKSAELCGSIGTYEGPEEDSGFRFWKSRGKNTHGEQKYRTSKLVCKLKLSPRPTMNPSPTKLCWTLCSVHALLPHVLCDMYRTLQTILWGKYFFHDLSLNPQLSHLNIVMLVCFYSQLWVKTGTIQKTTIAGLLSNLNHWE